MQRSTRIILIVVGGIALLGLAVIGSALWFLARNAEGWVTQGRDQMQQGREAGQTLDSRGCVDHAMAEYRKDTGPISAITQRLWLSGCLQTAQPDHSICPRITADSTLGAAGKLLAARTGFCARHGFPGDQNCQSLAEAVEAFCFGIETPEAELLDKTPPPSD